MSPLSSFCYILILHAVAIYFGNCHKTASGYPSSRKYGAKDDLWLDQTSKSAMMSLFNKNNKKFLSYPKIIHRKFVTQLSKTAGMGDDCSRLQRWRMGAGDVFMI